MAFSSSTLLGDNKCIPLLPPVKRYFKSYGVIFREPSLEKIPKTDLGEGGLEWKIKPPAAYQLCNLGLGTLLSFSDLDSLPDAELL